MNALLQRENPRIGSAPLILLNPNASDLLPLRRWPPTRYVDLARRLLDRYPNLFIGFTGGPSEAVPITALANDVAQTGLSRSPAKQLCVRCSCFTREAPFWSRTTAVRRILHP